MRIIFFILLITIGVISLSTSLGSAGHIIFQWLGYHVEISAILLLILSLVVIIASFMLIYFLIFLKNIPGSIKKYYKEKRDRKDLLLLLYGFGTLYNGDINKAKQIANKIKIEDADQLKLLEPVIAVFIAQCNEEQYFRDRSNEQKLEDSYQDLLQYDETRLLGLKGLITLRISNQCYRDALSYAVKALALQERTDWLLKDLIEIYMELGFYEKAEQIIKKTMKYEFIGEEEANLALIKTFISNANYCISHSQVDAAVDLLEKVLKIDPSYHTAVTCLSRIYYKSNRKRAAYKVIEKAWRQCPSMELAKFMLSLCQDYTVKKKIDILKTFISLAPEEKEGYLSLVELYIKEEMLTEAREEMDKLLALHAADSYMSKLMALIEAKSNNNYSTIINWLNKI
jgi:HemY protein